MSGGYNTPPTPVANKSLLGVLHFVYSFIHFPYPNAIPF